ncbi:lysis protein, partial [Pseudomonas poae]
MSLFDLIPAQFRIAVVGGLLLAVVAGSAALAWTGQDWRYGRVLERQAQLQADTLNELSQASAALRRNEQDKRLALEQRLHNQDETHYKELTDEQTKQARLRDRLATA